MSVVVIVGLVVVLWLGILRLHPPQDVGSLERRVGLALGLVPAAVAPPAGWTPNHVWLLEREQRKPLCRPVLSGSAADTSGLGLRVLIRIVGLLLEGW